ncbi:hypothetical protein PCASD_05124 [Puccinia coronata f. sp. avenae]|uniref:Chitin-binding type-4 domain-containing protein n=1 Tax=Puccinia coronata f. sp. avenae TaxID=200324 RepID=A0A2N5V3M6_9BASI|nr:hypothetical protein PCASD_05124 [Puccinia coronata f. sp. avenae]
MKLGKLFTDQCGEQAASIISRAPFISQEIWKQRSPRDRQCRQRVCQGLFVEDQDLSNVPRFKPGQQIPVTIRVQIPHGGKAQLVLMDVNAQQPFQSQGEIVVLQDLGANFGNPRQPRVQTFSVQVPPDLSPACDQPGKCAISFRWQVRRTEKYDICSLMTIGE